MRMEIKKVRCPECNSKDAYQGLDGEYYTCGNCGIDFTE
jgi:transposase-like protein